MTQRILFAPIHGPSMIEMLPIACRIAKDGRFEPVFFIFNSLSKRTADILAESKIRVIGSKIPSLSHPEKGGGRPDFLIESHEDEKVNDPGFRKRIVRWALSLSLVSFLWYLLKFKGFLRRSKKFLLEEDSVAIVMMGDRHVGWETAMIKSANDHGIPTLIVPFAVSDPDSDIEARLRLPDAKQYHVSTLIERAAAKVFPKWVRTKGADRLFFIPVGNAMAAKILNMMPENPWTIGGGAAKRVAVDSTRTLRNFSNEGVHTEKMIITGKPGDDQIFQAMTANEPRETRRELGIGDSQYFILCSVPQLAEHGLLSWSEHWEEINYLVKTLSDQMGASVVLSLHPQSDKSNYEELAEKYGVVIADQRIYNLIPACDILVATYSSVVVQAIGSGKPTVVVDFYGLDFTYYDDEPGVIVMKERESLTPTIERLLYNREYYDEMVQAQLSRKSEWLRLDGECTSRVVNELYQMIDS